jgi:hypothetical protein
MEEARLMRDRPKDQRNHFRTMIQLFLFLFAQNALILRFTTQRVKLCICSYVK